MKGIKNETKGKPKIRARPARRRNSVPSARQPADSVQPAVAAELIVTTSGLHSNPPRRTMEDAAIDEHYNARRDLDSHQENMMRRKFSPIYHLKCVPVLVVSRFKRSRTIRLIL